MVSEYWAREVLGKLTPACAKDQYINPEQSNPPGDEPPQTYGSPILERAAAMAGLNRSLTVPVAVAVLAPTSTGAETIRPTADTAVINAAIHRLAPRLHVMTDIVMHL